MRKIKLGILGITGAVGQQMLSVIEEKNLPIEELRVFASERSKGQMISFQGKEWQIDVADESCFEGLDFVLGAVENELSKKYAPMIQKAGAVYIDNSSAFRLESNVPLVIPEINPEAVFMHQGIIANPNCVTIIGLMAIAPIHRINPVKRVIASSYQAVSGAGKAGMDELIDQMEAFANHKAIESKTFSRQIACNLIPQIGGLNKEGYTSEEMKFQNESRKILGCSDLKVNCTCVRVPVIRSHAISLTIELTHPMSVKAAQHAIEKAEGVDLMEPYPAPLDTSNQDIVYVGRLRKDISDENSLVLWCCGDQIRKGAATNAVQILELLMKQEKGCEG